MADKITFLGTGTSQGIPMIGCQCDVCKSPDWHDKRLRTSAYIEYEGLKLVIDAGPDFRYQMLREGIITLDAILLTHEHIDHIGGLDDVRAFNYLEKRSFPIYCEQHVLDALKSTFSYAFADEKYPGVPSFDVHVIDDNPFKIGGIEIIPIRAMHYKLPVLGYRFGKLGYLTDANHIGDDQIEKLRGIDVFVINCVRMTPHISHFSLPEAIEVARKVGAGQTFLTHLSHQLPCHEQLVKELPEGITDAYDTLKVPF
jgi:Metal-dependent hydrolases of the beta-lactamase superfamily I